MSRFRRVACVGVAAAVAALALPLGAAAALARRELAPDGIGNGDAFLLLGFGHELDLGLDWV